ncbi:cellulose binding domain-containing protein, partial [Glycomyces sp. L485]|uniref:cellulose binding domain-containing protein n=1 Tax=Glycomyces sp. L485 TaxID=2909235 RepID=UPI001F4A4B90
DSYQGDNQGVIWIEFDPDAGTTYVGVADPDNPVYVSDDDGATWEPLAGASQIGTVDGYDNVPKQAAIDEVNGHLYIITSWDPGPYNGSPDDEGDERGGSVWRYDTAAGTWTEIHPGPNGTDYRGFGFGGLALDKQNPGTLMVSSVNAWWPDETTYRSTDSGETWTRSWMLDGWPNRVDRFDIDHSSVGWLDWGETNPGEAEISPKYGWMIDSMAIDPHDSDRFMYGTGATIYGSNNLTAWDSDQTITISPMVHGLEETSVQDLAAPPEGPELLSALGDIGGFAHTDLDTVPDEFFQSPTHGNTRSIDFAELSPNVVVRVGEGDEDTAGIGVSSDGGANWWAGATPGGITGAGTVAVSANANAIVWSPDGADPQRSTDYGSSWSPVSGLPAGARVESDRADADRFYGFWGGTFYYSVDGGSSFTASSYSDFPAEGDVRFGAVPGDAGHVWLTGGADTGAYGMWRSVDGGQNWTRIEGFDAADTVGFGAAAPGQDYPAIYASASYDGERGIWRSTDEGQNWSRINDDDHQWGWTGSAITGDPNVFGRVYVGTNGRGVIVGESSDYVPDDPTGTPSQSPSDGPSETPSETPTTEPPSGDCVADWSAASSWPGGHQGGVTVTNDTGAAGSGWTVEWTFTGEEQVANLWGGEWSQSGDTVTVTNADWNGTIAAGGSTTFGYTASGGDAPTAVEPACTLD